MDEFITSLNRKYHDLKRKYTDLSSIEKGLLNAGVVTTSFYLCQNVFQRSMGFVGLHGARSTPVTAGLGLAVTSCSLVFSHFVDNKIHQSFGKPGSLIEQRTKQSSRAVKKDYVQQLLVGLTVFAVLERGAFRTTFPSSVIAPGVFANSLNTFTHSVLATGEAANEPQRRKIQVLGWRHGCHQCGSRQLLSKETFIADHMPPTKFANEMNAKWWRRLLHITVKQRLWAQCRSCFSLQGNAVRTGSHLLVYHTAFKVHHLAPAVAIVLLQQKDVREALCEWTDWAVDPAVSTVEACEKYITKMVGSKWVK